MANLGGRRKRDDPIARVRQKRAVASILKTPEIKYWLIEAVYKMRKPLQTLLLKTRVHITRALP